MNHDGATAPDPLDGAFSAQWLTGETFPALQYVVPGLIPEGLSLLSAAPKIGKSWMVLGLGIAAATGGLAFGRLPVTQRPVLYLALEDGQRRLQGRLETLGADPGPAGLLLMTTLICPVDETITAYLDRHAGENPLVVLDTLGKVRSVYNGSNAYQHDYAQMSGLKKLVDGHPGSSLVIVHHTKKGETTDFLDSVSGTQGLAGAADSVLVLRRGRHEGAATLSVTSRDAPEREPSLTLTKGTWTLNGNSLEEAEQAAHMDQVVAGLGDARAELIATVSQYAEGLKPADLVTLLGWPRSKVDTYLKRACDAGQIEKLERGRYGPVRSARSVRSADNTLPESLTSDASYTPLLEVIH
ncbi:AAA family ATPase [Kocuria sp. M1N1S27]|uniref:AAA family ATPase n=1 Tax=Kocuria kalidii TaxID=3376283 RepID=UPI003798835A